MEQENKQASAKSTGRALVGQMLNLGSVMAGGMLLFGLGGHWLDRRYGTGRLWLLVGLFVGLFYGFYETWKAVRALDKAGEGKGRLPDGAGDR